MQQQRELQDQIDPILPHIPGFAEPSTYVHQWGSPHRDTRHSDPQEEAPPEEEVEEASLEEEETLEEEAADSPVGEDQHKAILKEDHLETDL